MKSVNGGSSHTRDVLACLAVPSRYRLVRAIAGAELCVGELAISIGLSQSCTTRHLQALERAGLVRGKRDGRRVRFVLCTEADGARSVLGLVLAEAATEPVPAVRTATSRAPSRRVKPLPKKTFEVASGDSGNGRDGDRMEPVGPSTAEQGPDSRLPARPFRRQDIEDYLL